jgi:hypothetical protein
VCVEKFAQKGKKQTNKHTESLVMILFVFNNREVVVVSVFDQTQLGVVTFFLSSKGKLRTLFYYFISPVSHLILGLYVLLK